MRHSVVGNGESGSDKPLMYGRTAVDLILVAGSLSDACRFLDFVMNEYGYPLKTRTEVKCLFGSPADGLVMIFFDRSYKHLTTPRLITS